MNLKEIHMSTPDSLYDPNSEYDFNLEWLQSQLSNKMLYLVGRVSSGDHPIDWDIMEWSYNTFRYTGLLAKHGDIDEEELEGIVGSGIVLELPPTASDADKLN